MSKNKFEEHFENHFLRAAKNIGRYGDNDTLPYDIDTRFIKDNAEELAELASKIFSKIVNSKGTKIPPDIFHERLVTPSGSSGFRVTTKIDPFWNIYLNGLSLDIAERLEPNRYKCTFSYRYLSNGNTEDILFDKEFTWRKFREEILRAISQTSSEQYIVETDISSFYERISHHSLENLIKDLYSENGSHLKIAEQVNFLLGVFSSSRSFGLPIGSQASRILAELFLNQIDSNLQNSELHFYRYVDDFVFICKSKEEAYEALSHLAKTLSNYGLSLNKTKTNIFPSNQFVKYTSTQLGLNDDSDIGKLKALDIYFDPYTDNPDTEYNLLKEELEGIDLNTLLLDETLKSEPDSFLVSQITRSLPYSDTGSVLKILKTLLSSENIHAFRANWSTIMRIVNEILSNDQFIEIHADINNLLDSLIVKTPHLLLPDTNMLYFLRALRQYKNTTRAIFVQNTYDTRKLKTIKRACIDCWRNWSDRPQFDQLKPNINQLYEVEERMFWLFTYKMGDSGKHFRDRSSYKPTLKNNWHITIDALEPKETDSKSEKKDSDFKNFGDLYMKWAEGIESNGA